MKLRNKKTGEIGWLYCDHISIPKKMTVFAEDKDLSANHWDYNSLAELNKEWEDYIEPKEYWYIEPNGVIARIDEWDCCTENDREVMRLIGNYFETKEEAEKAVEKLKAWKRLKDKGFIIYSWDYEFDMVDKPAQTIILRASVVDSSNKDLDLLFGGEE